MEKKISILLGSKSPTITLYTAIAQEGAFFAPICRSKKKRYYDEIKK